MPHRPVRLLAGLATALALLPPVTPQAAGAEWRPVKVLARGPLSPIELSDDLACQVVHDSTPLSGQVFPGTVSGPADCGTFVAIGATLYAPDFTGHAAGTATSSGLGRYTPFRPVSQTPRTGAGTPTDPYTVVTVVDAGATGVRVWRQDTYVDGDSSYRSDVTIQNTSRATVSGRLYHGLDCYLNDGDTGIGLAAPNPATQGYRVACVSGAFAAQLVGLSPGNSYVEARYDNVWRIIGSRRALPNTFTVREHDNAAAIGWDFRAGPRETVVRSFQTEFVVSPPAPERP